MNHFRQSLVLFVSLLMIASALSVMASNGMMNGSQQHHLSASPRIANSSAETVHSSLNAQLSQLEPYSPLSSFRFIETGLPTGTQWSVSLDNVTLSTRNPSISFDIGNGTYNYSVSNSLDFFSPQATGIINTSNATQIVHYYGYLHTAGYVNLSSGIVSQNPGLNYNNFVIPYGLFDNYSHSIIVASNGNNSILSLNASNYRINGFLQINGSPGGLALNPNGTIYATTFSQLLEISQNMKIEDAINVSNYGVKSVAYNEYSGLIYVGTQFNGTYIFNSTTLSMVNHLKRLDVLSTQGLAIDTANHLTVAADFLNNSIWFINGSIPFSYFSSPGIPISILSVPNSQDLLISTFSVSGYSMFSLNTSSRFVNAIGGFSWGMAMAFNEETDSPFASDIANNGIIPLDSQLNSGFASLKTSYEPYFVIFDPMTKTIVSGGIYSNSLSLVNFSNVPVNLTFNEQGLNNGQKWGIEINGYNVSTSNATLSLQVLPGQVNFKVINPSGYTTNDTGTITATPTNSNATIYFHRLYAVNFLETGIPSGTSWSIDLNGVLHSSTTGVIETNLTAGNYSYLINGTSTYKAALSQGTISITGNENITVIFSTNLYTVELLSHGLPQGYVWSAKIDGRLFFTNTSYLFLNVMRGDMNFTINPVPGYIPNPGRYMVTVSGNDTVVNISWLPFLFGVNITEIGLPAGEIWGVSVGNFSGISSNSTIEIYLSNGTYAIHPFTRSGNYSSSALQLKVSGKNIELNVNFSPVLYSVNFQRQGYNGIWYVNLSNGMYSGPISGSSYTFSLMNGTYLFRTSSAEKIYQPSHTTGSFSVNGTPISVSITFLEVKYTVTFREYGLPSGAEWYIDLSNGIDSGIILGNSDNFSLTNGSYSYVIKSLSGEFRPISAAGSFSVSGSKETIVAGFMEVTFNASFRISNLPGGTSWSIFLNGTIYKENITANIYSILLPNGTYSIKILSSSRNYYPSDFSVRVDGHNVSSTITLHPVLYNVTIEESGLPTGTQWQVTLPNGTVLGSQYSNIYVHLMNGTYHITYLSSNHIYRGSEMTLSVNGSNEIIYAQFTKVTFAISFDISGQYSPFTWYLIISGNDTVGPNHGNITVYLSNGTYTFTVDPMNSSWYDFNGVLHVNGSGKIVYVSFKPVLYDVNFTVVSPSGLKEWNLEIAGNNYTINGTYFEVGLQNGSYVYVVSGITGYETYTSHLNVTGADETVILYIHELQYDVSFISNLKHGALWNVSLSNGDNYSSFNHSLMISMPNGRYNYTATSPGYNSVSGYIMVKDHPVTVRIHFVTSLHTVKFMESGLPRGTQWWVNISGIANISSSNHVARIMLHNGHYSYTVSHVNGYMDVHSGDFTVNNKSITLHLHFVRIEKTLYVVSFIEFMPPGVSVNITVNHKAVTENDIELMNGTYHLTVDVTGTPFKTPVRLPLVISGSQVQVIIIISPMAIWIAMTSNSTPLPPAPVPSPMNPLLICVSSVFSPVPHPPQISPLLNLPQVIPPDYFESMFFFADAPM